MKNLIPNPTQMRRAITVWLHRVVYCGHLLVYYCMMSDIILSQLLLEKCNNEQPTGETIKIALKSKKRTLLCQFDNTSQFLSLSARSMKEIRVNPTYDSAMLWMAPTSFDQCWGLHLQRDRRSGSYGRCQEWNVIPPSHWSPLKHFINTKSWPSGVVSSM